MFVKKQILLLTVVCKFEFKQKLLEIFLGEFRKANFSKAVICKVLCLINFKENIIKKILILVLITPVLLILNATESFSGVYKIECETDTTICFSVPVTPGNPIQVKGKFKSVGALNIRQPQEVAADCMSSNGTYSTGIFIHTDATNPEIGIGYIGVEVCADPSNLEAVYYKEDTDYEYVSYSIWLATY